MSGQGHQLGERTGFTSTERARRCRARRKAGAQLVRLEITREVLECLIAHGWTSRVEALDPDKLSDAVWDLLDCWCRNRPICAKRSFVL